MATLVGLFGAPYRCYNKMELNLFAIHKRPGLSGYQINVHDDIMKWKHFPRHWPFVRELS